jgi:uncharacterized protein YdaU (DUF1376 family)
MPLYVSDYLADTYHLEAREHGAYLLLIFHYWQRRQPLPDDDRKLARIARLSEHEWAEVRDIIAEFFEIRDGCWHQKRVDQELQHFNDKSEKARQAAFARHSAGGQAQSTADANAKRTKSERGADALRMQSGRSAIQIQIQIQPSQPRARTRVRANPLNRPRNAPTSPPRLRLSAVRMKASRIPTYPMRATVSRRRGTTRMPVAELRRQSASG